MSLLRNDKGREPIRRSRRQKRQYQCVACRQTVTFAWTCRHCTFVMCQDCMEENRWGMTCNNVTWTCPDCGGSNDYGNQ